MSLLNFWPTDQNILDCIKPEAENPQDAVFLAVHQPMKLKRRSFASDQEQDGTEHDLLDDFLRDDLPTGTLLIPILGNSGIGKSHLVRWLDVQLRQRSDRSKRHVIRIPKSSSLKTVLRRILDGLEGHRYDTIRRQLESARERMDHIQATERIRAELLTAIRRRHEVAMSRKETSRRSGGAVDPNDERWIGHGDRRYLPALLSDPITSRMLMETHSKRTGIIAELARHLTEDTTTDQAPRRQFEEADFVIPDDLKKEIANESGLPARKYLQKLEQSNGQARLEAIQLLNEIIDDAIAPLATPADTSLSELFYSVRQELLAEGRELVLLVEDFAVLAGIQGALLDAMIREGVRGTQEACVMRTALAVTEGYFTSFETVRTRAVFGWYISEIPSDTETQTISRICDFAGAYLNAARFGTTALPKHVRTDSHDLAGVPDFADFETLNDQEAKQLEAFGYSPNGRALFPLNRNAIATIADWKMRDADRRLRFNPRTIINELLIPVLREYRIQFERGEFPPEWFLSYDPNTLEPDVRLQIRERVRNPQDQKRLYALMRFWGGNPKQIATAHLQQAVYEAFNLPPIAETSPDVRVEPDRPPVTVPAPKTSPPSTVTMDRETELEAPEIRSWIDRLEKWSHGQDMIQRDANQLRSMIAECVLAAIDWDAELLRPLRKAETAYLNEWVFLPASKGASHCVPANAFITVATDEQFNNPDVQERIILSLRAVVRFCHHKTWNFDRADEEFPRYANLIELLSKQAITWLHSNYHKVDGDAVPALTEGLIIGGRLLSVPTAHAREDSALVDALFQFPLHEPAPSDSNWDQLRCRCFEVRPRLKEELLSRMAARQGGGGTAFAIDAARLLDALRSVKTDWSAKSPFPKHRSGEEGILWIEAHSKDLARRLPSAISQRREEISSQWQRICAELGDSFDKQQVVGSLFKVLQVTKQFGIRDPQDNIGTLTTLVEQFRDAAVSQCLQHVQRIGQETEGGALLSALAQVDDASFSLVCRFVNDIRVFLERTERQIRGHLAVLGENIVESAVEGLDSRLRAIQQAIPNTSGGNAS